MPRLVHALVAAAMLLAAPVGMAEAAHGRVRRTSGPSSLQPVAQQQDEEAAFHANELGLKELKLATDSLKEEALLGLQEGLQPAQNQAAAAANPAAVEILPNEAEVARDRRLEEEREETLKPEGRRALEAANRFHAQLMEPHAAAAVGALLNRLLAAQTFVRLSNPIRGGHLVRYRVVRGSPAAVQAFAAEFGITATAGELDVAPHQAEEVHHRAEAVVEGTAAAHYEGEGQQEAEDAAPANFPDFVDKELTAGERLELDANNRGQVARLACPVCEKFTALTFRLAREDTYVRFYGAIQHGHTVDYELVRGARAAVRAIAAEVGLLAGDTQLTAAPTEADSVHADADVTTRGFEAITTNNGGGELIN